MKIYRKAYGFFIRQTPPGLAEMLVYPTEDHTLRFPGGTVEDHEDPLAGLYREIHEETGIQTFKILRKLGVHAYYKPDVHKRVERHDYLLLPAGGLPDSFSFSGLGAGEDHGEVFQYRWIDRHAIHDLNWEFKPYINPDYIPEFFLPEK